MKPTLCALLLLIFCSAASARSIKIIVNENNPYTEISLEQLRDFYLKKSKEWPNGTPVRFFDRGEDTAERRHFLREFMKRTQRDLELYWIGQKLYTGHSAPTQVTSDNMAASLVSRFPGGIGYVSTEFPGSAGVKVIEVKGF
jgi:ABC-type phosphate transport system substrate-binding protein